MAFFSNFADQAVVLPLAVVVALGLALGRWWRGLAAWCVAVGGVLGTMLVLKVAGVELALHLGWSRPASPSGHVAAGCVVYGGLAVLLLAGRLPRAVIAAVPLAVVATIGESRLWLGAHTLAEVLIGGAVGLMGVAVLAWMAGPRPKLAAWPLLVATACTALAMHGLHIPAERVLHEALWVH